MRGLYRLEFCRWFKSTKFGSRYLVEWLSERDEIWQLDRGPYCTSPPCRLVNFGPGISLGAKIVKDVKKIVVTLFLYSVWPTASARAGSRHSDPLSHLAFATLLERVMHETECNPDRDGVHIHCTIIRRLWSAEDVDLLAETVE